MNRLAAFFQKINFRQNAVWLTPLLAIITFPLWSIPVGKFLAPKIDEQQVQHQQNRKSREFQLDGVQITQYQHNQKTAFIIAKQAKTRPNSTDILFMKSVNADVYDAKGGVTKITARTGEYNTQTEQLTLTEDVIVRKIADDQTLYTDLLYYYSKTQVAVSPEKSKIIAPDAIINSGNFIYSVREASYKFGEGVRCTLTNFDNGI